MVLWDVMLYNLVDILTRPLGTKVCTQHYIPKDSQFHEHDCKILKSHTDMNHIYEDGSKSFQPDVQKPRQMENTARDI